MIEFLKEIETKYDVSSITYKNIQIWPILRMYYFRKHMINNVGIINNKEGKFSLSKSRRIKNTLYGFGNLFRKYNYIVFTNMDYKRLVNNNYVDKIADTLISEIGIDNTLIVEQPIQRLHFSRSEIENKHIISIELFRSFCSLFTILRSQFASFDDLKIKNLSILDEINKRYSLNLKYNILLYKFFKYKQLFSIYFKIYKPDVIFLNCYYKIENQAAIYVAKELGIKTIELQHGLINEKHGAYNIFTELDKNFFPEYLLCFGDYFKNTFNNNNFIDSQNIYSIGNGYIDYINNCYKGDYKLFELVGKHEKTVAVTSQLGLEYKIINFIKLASEMNRDILYFFIPRDPDRDYSKYKMPYNMVILKHLDFYKIIKYVDFHSTIFSTCAFEAPAMGTPNILINIDNLSKQYLSVLLKDEEVTKITDSPNKFVNIILNWNRKNSNEIKKRHSGFYAGNHREKLRMALNEILGRKFG